MFLKNVECLIYFKVNVLRVERERERERAAIWRVLRKEDGG